MNLLLLVLVVPRVVLEPRLVVFPAGPQLRGSCGSAPRRTSAAKVAGQRSSPDINRELRRAAFPCGAQPQVQDGSIPRRTSTASSGWQRSPPNLNQHTTTNTPEKPQNESQRFYFRVCFLRPPPSYSPGAGIDTQGNDNSVTRYSTSSSLSVNRCIPRVATIQLPSIALQPTEDNCIS